VLDALHAADLDALAQLPGLSLSADTGNGAHRPRDVDEVAITSTASHAEAWVLAQRAIWFRLLPTRATWRVRARSTSAAAAVHVRVRAIDCRSRWASGTPKEAAFVRHAGISAGETCSWTCPVRRSAI